MAEKSDKKPDEKGPAAPPPAAPAAHDKKPAAGGGLLKSTPVLLGVVMIIEAAVLFAGFKMLGGAPKAARGAEAALAESGEGKAGAEGEGGAAKPIDKKQLTELPVLDFRASNKQTGRTFFYDVSIFILTRAGEKDRLQGAIKERENTIKDRVRTLIAQIDPEKLSEPGLETLRRQVKYQLDEIVGEGIEEVLVPRCAPYRADF